MSSRKAELANDLKKRIDAFFPAQLRAHYKSVVDVLMGPELKPEEEEIPR